MITKEELNRVYDFIKEFLNEDKNTKIWGLDYEKSKPLFQTMNKIIKKELAKEFVQPQLSDDVEWLFANIRNGVPNNYNVVHRSINQLEQHIQLQASEIERLKAQLKEQEQ